MPCPWPAGSRASLVLHTSGPLVRPQSRHMQRITPVTSEDPDPQPRVNLDQSWPRTRAVSERGSAPPSPWWGVVWPTLWPRLAPRSWDLGARFILSWADCRVCSAPTSNNEDEWSWWWSSWFLLAMSWRVRASMLQLVIGAKCWGSFWQQHVVVEQMGVPNSLSAKRK